MLCAMPVTVRINGLGELLDQQFSVVSRGQLLGLGMKDNAMQPGGAGDGGRTGAGLTRGEYLRS